MRRNGYLCTSGVKLDTAVRFPHPDFPLKCKISVIWLFLVIFLHLNAECPPYLYFQFVWPTDLESIQHASTPTSIIRTKYDTTIHCRVLAPFSANTSRDLVTLTFWPFDLKQLNTWLVTRLTLTPSSKTLRLCDLQLWVITSPVGLRWKYVRGHCACAESRDPWVGKQKQLHYFGIPTAICLFII